MNKKISLEKLNQKNKKRWAIIIAQMKEHILGQIKERAYMTSMGNQGKKYHAKRPLLIDNKMGQQLYQNAPIVNCLR